MSYIGVDIGGTKCSVVLGNKNGEILEKIKFATTDKESTTQEIKNIIYKLKNDNIKGIGVSCGGPLDSRKGLILSPPNLIGWDDVPIVEILENEFNIPTFLQNDANACAVAEWKYGAGRGFSNIIFLTFGTGMGAGLILNDRLYIGRNGNAGEIGHIRLEENGPVGYGKMGSFEGFCSGGGIAQLGKIHVMEKVQMGEKIELDEITAQSLAMAAKEGNEIAIDVYKKTGQYLGRGLSILMDLLNPDIIILGSIYARDSELMESEMYEVLRKEVLSNSLCDVVPSKLGENLGDVAALCIGMGGYNG